MFRIVKNFIALASGETIARLIAFAVYLYLARILGAEGYGIIALAAGVTLYLARITDFGMEALGTTAVARDRESMPELASGVLGMKLLVAFGLMLAGSGLAWLVSPAAERTVLVLYFLTLIPIALSTKWVHLGIEEVLPIGVWRIVGEALSLTLVLILVEGTEDLWLVPIAVLGGEALVSAALLIRLRLRGIPVGIRWNPGAVVPLFRRALPLLSQGILALLLYNSDLVFLRILRDPTAVGYFAAAYMLLSFVANIGTQYALSLLPTMARQEDAETGAGELYQTAVAHVFAVALPLALGGCFLAPALIRIGFGDGYEPSVVLLQLLIWVLPGALMRNVPWSALVARDRQHLLMRAWLYAVIANVGLNLALIPRFGVLGAAVATMVAEPLSAILLFRYARRAGFPVIPASRLLRPLLAAVPMGLALAATGSAGPAAQIVAGTGVYLAVLGLLGGIRIRNRLPVLDV